MIIYSQKIIRFLREIKSALKKILIQEVGVKVHGERFYVGRASYPIQVVIFNQGNSLGYFDSSFFELGFNECMMHVVQKELHNVIRHELAHYFTFIRHGETAQPHSPDFRAFCRQMGWGEEVYQATFRLETAAQEEESAIFRKVKKLMALSASSNQHEAEQAMIKSQQLLMKHNIEARYLEDEEEEKLVLKRLLKQKKKGAKMCAIANILQTFFVSIVFNRAGAFTYLEVLGSAVNVEIAEYVAAFLHAEMEKLWDTTQLTGTVAKNSFFLGLAQGYCKKIDALKREYQSAEKQALMVIEKKLSVAQALVYPHLSKSRSGGRYSREASLLGEQMGRKLTINPALKSTSDQQGFIGYKH